MVMIKRLLRIGVFITLMSVGLLQSSSLALATGPPSLAHSEYEKNSCKVACHVTLNNREDRIDAEEDEPDDLKTTDFPRTNVALTYTGVGLLTENSIWKNSSWVPPDITLMSGAYSVSL